MSQDDGITILFDSEVSVSVPDGESVGMGDVLVAYMREEEDYKVFVSFGDCKMADHCCGIKQYRYEVTAPLSVHRIRGQIFYHLRLDSGNTYALCFAEELQGIAFASYVLTALWLESDRTAPLTLTLRDGQPDTPFAAGNEVKISSLVWDVAGSVSNEAAFEVKGVLSADRELTKSVIRLGSGDVSIIDTLLIGCTRKTKLLVAADGVVMYVDVSGLLSAATPSPNLSFQLSNASQQFSPPQSQDDQRWSVRSATSPPPPPPGYEDPQACVPQPPPAAVRHNRGSSTGRLGDPARQADPQRTSCHGSDAGASADGEGRSLLRGYVRERALQDAVDPARSYGSPAQSPYLYPVDFDPTEQDDALADEVRAVPFYTIDAVLTHPAACALRLVGYIVVAAVWAAKAHGNTSPGWRAPYGVVATACFAALGVLLELLLVYHRRSLDNAFFHTVAFRGKQVYASQDAHADLTSRPTAATNGFVLVGMLGVFAYPLSESVHHTHHLGGGRSLRPEYVFALWTIPLFTATFLCVLLKFRLLAAVLHNVLREGVPLLRPAAGWRRDFAISSSDVVWIPNVITLNAAARQLFTQAASVWQGLMHAACFALVSTVGWSVWVIAYYRSSPHDRHLKFAPLMATGVVLCIAASTLRRWGAASHESHRRFMMHYEWRQTAEAQRVLSKSGHCPPGVVWAEGLAYFRSSAVTGVSWSLVHLSDNAYDLLAIGGALAVVFCSVMMAVQSPP